MNVTLQTIAQRTGLSVNTVSQCLRANAPKAHQFRAETREMVRRVAAELGYRPNAAARATANGRFGTAALVMSINPIRSSLFEGLLCGLHDELHANDMQLSVARMPDSQLSDDSQLPKILREWSCDGMLINYTDAIPKRMQAIILEHQIPAVWINSKQEHDCVRPDDFGGARDATQALLKMGHQRIAYSDFSHGPDYPSPHYSVPDRLAGYQQAMQQAGLAPRLWIAEQGEKIPGAQRVAYVIEQLKRPDRPTAVVSYNHNDLIVIHAAAMSLGLSIPSDLSVVGFSPKLNTPLGVPMGSVLLPEVRMGQEAVRMLLKKISNPSRLLPAKVLPTHFDPAGTCVPPKQ